MHGLMIDEQILETVIWVDGPLVYVIAGVCQLVENLFSVLIDGKKSPTRMENNEKKTKN